MPRDTAAVKPLQGPSLKWGRGYEEEEEEEEEEGEEGGFGGTVKTDFDAAMDLYREASAPARKRSVSEGRGAGRVLEA